MAKKDKDAAFNEFLADLKAIAPGIEEALKDDKVSAKLREGVLARSDYSSAMDALRAEQQEMKDYLTQEKTKIEGWQRWYGDTIKEVAGIKDKLAQYEDIYGELETTADKRKAAKQLGLSKEELDSALSLRDTAALKIADDLTDIKIDFRDRFKEKLNTQEVYKIAGERQVDLLTAYDSYIKDRVEEQKNKDIEERIKKAKDEAVQEYASKHNLPLVDTRSDVTHVLDTKDIPKTSQDRVAAALAAFQSSRR